VLNQHEGHAAGGRQALQQLREGFQAAGRRSDTDYRQRVVL